MTLPFELHYGELVPSRQVAMSDVTLDCLVSGPEKGPLAICLHGFPDTRATYRHLTPVLVELGYRVVVPAMRGFAPSSLASDGNYQLSALCADALRLHDAFEGESDAVIIGHDWGATTVYGALASGEGRWRKAVAMSVPPFISMAQAFSNYDQLKLSWYMWLFQTPLAHTIVSANDRKFLERLWADWSPGYDAVIDVANVRMALGTNENLFAALEYYRQMFDGEVRSEEFRSIHDARFTNSSTPLLYLHGTACGCISTVAFDDPLPFLAPGSRYERLEGLGHFVHLEDPQQVGQLIAEWLSP